MTKKPIIVIGSGGHAKSLIDSIERIGAYDIKGMVSLEQSDTYKDYRVIGNDNDLEKLFQGGINRAAIGIGYLGEGDLRERLVSKLHTIGFDLPAIVDPTAVMASDVQIADGVFIGKGAIINSNVQIGECSIINSGSIVEHDVTVGSFCHVAPGSVLCGDVSLGKASFVGATAVLKQGVKVGERSVIGAGAVTLSSIPSGEVWIGNPAKKMEV